MENHTERSWARQARQKPDSKKLYDRAYFDRWYRDPSWVVIQRDHLERRMHLAVSAAEWMLERPIESVIDIGCGEGAWRAALKRIRPQARYVGLDPSEYAVARFGKSRNLIRASVGDLGSAWLRQELARREMKPPYDLVVCCDVLHYVPTPELEPGLRAIAGFIRSGGLAYLEFFAREDSTEGDEEAFQPRSAATYARRFRAAGLTHLGLHSYVIRRALARELMKFEEGWAAPRRASKAAPAASNTRAARERSRTKEAR